MNKTHIEWTATYLPDGTIRPGYTSNPVKYRDADGKAVWGCVKTSPGCAACYAETLAKRYGRGGPFTAPVMQKLTPFVDEQELRAILRSKAPAGSRVFLGDMTDVFGPWVTDEMLDQVFATMALRPDLVFQVLTKRPERMREYCSQTAAVDGVSVGARVAVAILGLESVPARAGAALARLLWPLPNVWLGASAENQHWLEIRWEHLRNTPAAVRFLSCEPLLGPLVLTNMDCWRGADGLDGESWEQEPVRPGHMRGLGWVIVGGESGPGARPMDLAWARSIVQQCQAAGVACFVKQLGSRPIADEINGACGNRATIVEVNGARHHWRFAMRSAKGGEEAEWPEDLRVREFPAVSHA